jgi:activator of HSP90 ATPase
MHTDRLSRRQFSARLAAVLALLVGLSVAPRRWAVAALVPPSDEVSNNAEAIHQEVTFDAAPARIYQALTNAKDFSELTKFSTVPNAPPAQIASAAGGTFSLFGGHIVGRHIELVPNRRVVQAWRATDWPDGAYSIARFELRPQGAKTLLVFDHTGFPAGQGKHLAEGWHANYWEPLKKYLK